jgi:hypothetical protein
LSNFFVIQVGGKIIPLPPGVDVSSQESLLATIHLMHPANFITPLLAHTVGTFVGALLVSKWTASQQLTKALLIGLLFFIAGFYEVMVLNAPAWFEVLDVTLAYFPMAYLGYRVGAKGSDESYF